MSHDDVIRCFENHNFLVSLDDRKESVHVLSHVVKQGSQEKLFCDDGACLEQQASERQNYSTDALQCDAVVVAHSLPQSHGGEKAFKCSKLRLEERPASPPIPLSASIEQCGLSQVNRRDGLLSASYWGALKSQAIERGLKPASVVLTIYAEILSTWSGTPHFTLGCRRIPEDLLNSERSERYSNSDTVYLLEVDFRGMDSFASKAKAIQRQIDKVSQPLECGAIQQNPALSRMNNTIGDLPYLFVRDATSSHTRWRETEFRCYENLQTNLELSFCEQDDGQLCFAWDLREEYFPTGLIDNIWGAFNRLLIQIAHNQTLWAQSRFEVASSTMQTRIYSEGEIPRGLLHDRLETAVQASAYKSVLETSAGVLTYHALRARSSTVARTLLSQGIEPGELIPVVMDRSEAFIVAILGILMSGAAFVPIEPTLSPRRVNEIVCNSGARVLLTQTHYALSLKWPEAVDVVAVDKLSPTGETVLGGTLAPDSLAYVLYTANASGNPKGIMNDHMGVLNTIVDINRRFEVNSGDKLLGVSSCSSDLAVYDIFGTLQAGATLIYPDTSRALSPSYLLELMLGKRITIWNSSPAMMSLLVETALRQCIELPSLRLVLLSNGEIPPELPSQIKRFAPTATIVCLGGAPEASIWSSYTVIEHFTQDWQGTPYTKPLTNQGWQICDAQGHRTPTWTIGELCLLGVGLSSGYWQDDDETRRRFIKDVCSGTRLFRTGNYGRILPDGGIEFVSLTSNQAWVELKQCDMEEDKGPPDEAINLIQRKMNPGWAAMEGITLSAECMKYFLEKKATQRGERCKRQMQHECSGCGGKQ